MLQGNLVAVGTNSGYVQVWDVAANKQISKLVGHTARVGALAWSADVLSSGSRDRMILQRDVRTPASTPERRLPGHRQEVNVVLIISTNFKAYSHKVLLLIVLSNICSRYVESFYYISQIGSVGSSLGISRWF